MATPCSAEKDSRGLDKGRLDQGNTLGLTPLQKCVHLLSVFSLPPGDAPRKVPGPRGTLCVYDSFHGRPLSFSDTWFLCHLFI